MALMLVGDLQCALLAAVGASAHCGTALIVAEGRFRVTRA